MTLIPFIGISVIRFIYLTNRKIFHLPADIPKEPIIFACWHGDLLMQPFFYFQFRKIPKLKVLISDHFDGVLISRIIKFLKFDTIAGSTNRNAAKVLIQAIKGIKEGYDIGITPDGPQGPRYFMSDGIVVMAQKTGSKVIVYNCRPTKYWQLGSWDRFVIPKPFGTLEFFACEPIDLSGYSLEDAKKLIHERLMEHAL